MVYTTQELEKQNGEYEFSGITFCEGKATSIQMRKARGWERIKSPKLWFKPWIYWKSEEFKLDSAE